MTTELQKLLRDGIGPTELYGYYGIEVKEHKQYPNLKLFRYNQFSAKFEQRCVRESRGIILDSNNDWACVARPFDKFFNVEEEEAAVLDWKSARIWQKMDGSLTFLYHYGNAWNVASSGLPDASGPVGHGETFAELFWRTWKELGYHPKIEPFFKMRRELTYMFELQTPHNRVVIPHSESSIIFLGARDRYTGEEYSPDEFPQFKWKRPALLTSNTLDSARAKFKEKSGYELEGYVAVDKHFNRVKIKHPDYLRLHHMKSGVTDKGLVDVARKGETPELISHFPEFKERLYQISANLEALERSIEANYRSCEHLETQKDFALRATEMPFSGILFGLRSGKIASVKEGLAKISLDHVAKAVL